MQLVLTQTDEVSPSPLNDIKANSETKQFALIGSSKKQRKIHRYRQRRKAQGKEENQEQENNGHSSV